MIEYFMFGGLAVMALLVIILYSKKQDDFTE